MTDITPDTYPATIHLNPCPFCGQTPDVDNPATFREVDGSKWGAVVCCCVGPEVRTGYASAESWKVAAAAEWNRRVFEPGRERVDAPRRIYVASSWRNEHQQGVVATLRDAGHEVYDFRNPAPGNTGFAWSQIDPDWLGWQPERFADLVHNHPVAIAGFGHDKAALDWCDTCVLVLPCGRSAHLEAGYAAGQGKQVFFLLHPDRFEPELMYELGSGYACSVGELLPKLAALAPSPDPVAPLSQAARDVVAEQRRQVEVESLLREVLDEGLIYWEPNTARGYAAKTDMIVRCKRALAAKDHTHDQ